MAITQTLLTEGFSSVASTSKVTATFAPTSGRLLTLYFCYNGNNFTPVVSGVGATWVAQTNVDSAGGVIGWLFRARPSAPVSGACTIGGAVVGVNLTYWAVSEWDGTDTSSTDGAGAFVQSVVGTTLSTNTTAFALGLAPLGDTANVVLSCFGLDSSAGLTTGAGLVTISSTKQDFRSFRTAQSNTTAAAVSTPLVSTGTRTFSGIAVELKAKAQIVRELSGSISIPFSVSGDAPVSHNLGGAINAASTASGTIQTAGHFLTGDIAAPTVLSQNLGLTHLLGAASITVPFVVEADAAVVGRDIFSRTAQDFQLEGELIIRAKARERLRKLINPSSPNFTRSFAVSTDATQAIDLLSLQNARFSMLLPGSTNIHPYRVAPTATAANTNGALLFSGRNPSLVALSVGTTAMHIFTSVSTVLPLRVKLL